jgi:hypothetical protein
MHASFKTSNGGISTQGGMTLYMEKMQGFMTSWVIAEHAKVCEGQDATCPIISMPTWKRR